MASCPASDPASATCRAAAPALTPSARNHAAVDVAPIRRAADRRSTSATAPNRAAATAEPAALVRLTNATNAASSRPATSTAFSCARTPSSCSHNTSVKAPPEPGDASTTRALTDMRTTYEQGPTETSDHPKPVAAQQLSTPTARLDPATRRGGHLLSSACCLARMSASAARRAAAASYICTRSFTTRPGTPATTDIGGTSWFTTVCAARTLPAPTLHPAQHRDLRADPAVRADPDRRLDDPLVLDRHVYVVVDVVEVADVHPVRHDRRAPISTSR